MAGGAAGTQGLGAMPSQPTGAPSGVNFDAVRNDTTMGDTFRGAAPQSQQTFGQRMSSFMPGAFGMSAGAPQPPQAQQTAPTFQPPAPTFPAYQQPAPTFQPPPPQMRNAYMSSEEMAAQQGGLQALQQALRGKGVDLGYQPSVDAIPYPAPAPAPVAPAMRPTPVAPPSQVEMANARQQARAAMANRRGSKVAPMPAVRSTPIR